MIKLLLLSKGFVWLTIGIYIISSIVFYFYQNQSIWSKGPAIYSLVLEYITFFIILLVVIVFPLYKFFTSGLNISLPFYYYVACFVILVNVFCSVLLFVSDKKKYPEMKSTLYSYVSKSPAGVVLLLSKDRE